MGKRRKEPAEQLFHARVRLGLSVTEAANLIGITEKQIRRLERGSSQPLYDTLKAYMRGYRIPPSAIFGEPSSVSILLVDDDARVVEAFKRAVVGFNERSRHRFHVDPATNAREALLRARLHPPDVAVVDNLHATGWRLGIDP